MPEQFSLLPNDDKQTNISTNYTTYLALLVYAYIIAVVLLRKKIYPEMCITFSMTKLTIDRYYPILKRSRPNSDVISFC